MKHFELFLLSLAFILLAGNSSAQNGLSFDGANDRLDCGNDPSVQITGNTITLEAWIYPTSWKPNIWEGNIIDKEQWSPQAGYMLRCGDGGRLNFNLGNIAWNELNTNAVLTLNQWQHVAGTYDGSMMRVYVDGVVIDSLAVTTTIANTTEHLVIGDNSFAGRNFPGIIDEVRIWNSHRTQAELVANMNNELCFGSPGLVAYYQLNHGTAGAANPTETVALDATGNGNHGAVQNFQLNGGSSNWVTGQTLTSGMSVATEAISGCGSVTAPSGNATYTTAGNYVDTLISSNAAGCDSVMYLAVTINSAPMNTITAQACSSYTAPSGTVYTVAGTYSDTLVASNGCDSITTINLTLGISGTSTITASSCTTYTVPSGNATYATSGTYVDTVSAGGGCDSIITINLTIAPLTETISAYDCNSYTLPSGNATYTTSGTYTDTLTGTGGCDSILTINLLIAPVNSSIVVSSCDAYTVPSGNATYTSSGLYFDTLTTGSGCDSVITINLTIAPLTGSISPVACGSYTVPSGNATYTNSGTYTDSLIGSGGCDSILTINLTIGTSATASISPSVCNTYTVPSGNATYTTSGTYMDTLQTFAGCDSVITINLTIGSTAETISVTECTSYTVPSGNATYTTSGTYVDTLQAASGCDSLLTINLTIGGGGTSTIDVSACDAYTVPSGTQTYVASGTYTDTLQSMAGCDSVITINLTIDAVETGLTQANGTLTATAGNATYQWLDCDDNNAAIAGETASTFTPTANGNYAVELTSGTCSDTSDCVAVTGVGVGELSPLTNLSVYPNPAQNTATINFGALESGASVIVQDMTGRVVQQLQPSSGTRVQLNVQALSGIYLVTVTTDASTRTARLQVAR